MCVHLYERLPGLVKVFSSVSHSTSHTKTLPQGASGYIHKLLLLKCTRTHTHTHTHSKVLLKTVSAQLFVLYETDDCQHMGQYVTAYRGWVALQVGVNVAQTEQLALLQEARFNPHGVQGRSSMTLWRKKQL